MFPIVPEADPDFRKSRLAELKMEREKLERQLAEAKPIDKDVIQKRIDAVNETMRYV